jgi:hypothetical protein
VPDQIVRAIYIRNSASMAANSQTSQASNSEPESQLAGSPQESISCSATAKGVVLCSCHLGQKLSERAVLDQGLSTRDTVLANRSNQ